MFAPDQHFKYLTDFTKTYQSFRDDEVSQREATCLKIQYPFMFNLPAEDDLFVGKYTYPAVYFLPQTYSNRGGKGFAYIFDEQTFDELLTSKSWSRDEKETLDAIADFWREENTAYKTRQQYSAELKQILPTDEWTAQSGVAFPLYRMAGSQLNYDKLLTRGITGLISEINKHQKSAPSPLYQAMIDALETLRTSIKFYIDQLSSGSFTQKHKNLLIQSLQIIYEGKPQNLHEAIQLMFLYNSISGSLNYGRIDEYLGDFLKNDLDSGTLTESTAQLYIDALWRIMADRNTVFDGRATIGGKGRRNPDNADLFCIYAIEATHRTKLLLPQLTLRCYEGMKNEVFDKALASIGEGNTFPMLYNDDANIPAVSSAFNVSLEEAEDYIPYGCGEYTIYHKSYGTPSGVINLLKALELSLHNGVDPLTLRQAGPQTGKPESFKKFEDLKLAYQKQTEYFTQAMAKQEKLEYDVAAANGAFLFLSILYDSCVTEGKAIFQGGIKYLGGTLEAYGVTNTADSLLALKKLVYDEQEISLNSFIKVLDRDFEDAYDLRKKVISFPKFGNDYPEADNMLEEVHEHICRYTASQAHLNNMHSYLIVNINNNANTVLGRTTMASADGRLACKPMANGNAPSGTSDKEGITALLNSMSKPSIHIHAGAVQNLKLSPELFEKHSEKLTALIKTYFYKGGPQLMISVVNRGDLENALKQPEEYQNLMVRVGGFSARFVELERDMQEEILSRTLY